MIKYLLITLLVQDGENQHRHRILHTTENEDIKAAGSEYASQFYADDEVEEHDGWWHFFAGSIAVELENVIELSLYEFQLMSRLFDGYGEMKPYFTIVAAGFSHEAQREEVEINCGENGKIMIHQDDDKLGFIIDVYGQNDIAGTMTIWEDDLYTPEDDDQPRSEFGVLTTCPVCGSTNTREDEDFGTTMRNCKACMSEWNIADEITLNGREGLEAKYIQPTGKEIEDFVDEWGQLHDEICAALDYDPKTSDDLLMVDYFFYEPKKYWIPITSSFYDERENEIADYLRHKE